MVIWLCPSHLILMTDEESKELTELSDTEIEELSEEMVKGLPDALSRSFGFDVTAETEGEEVDLREEGFDKQIENFLKDYRDALNRDSDQERTVQAFGVLDRFIQENFDFDSEPDSSAEFAGFRMLNQEVLEAIQDGYSAAEALGYPEYYELVDQLAVKAFDEEKAEQVNELFDQHETGKQGVLQRLFNPVIEEYFDYIGEHPEIDTAEEVRQYAEIYYELAELYKKALPELVAVLQIVYENEVDYEGLKQESFNNLLQKLGKKEYKEFNPLADAVNRKLRNSIGHRDFQVDPVDKMVEFHDRGDLVAEMSYSEFQETTVELLVAFQAVYSLQIIFKYRRLEGVPEKLEDLKKKEAE